MTPEPKTRLQDLVAGDAVVIRRSIHHYEMAKIDSVTRTQIKIGYETYSRESGIKRGSEPGWFQPCLSLKPSHFDTARGLEARKDFVLQHSFSQVGVTAKREACDLAEASLREQGLWEDEA